MELETEGVPGVRVPSIAAQVPVAVDVAVLDESVATTYPVGNTTTILPSLGIALVVVKVKVKVVLCEIVVVEDATVTPFRAPAVPVVTVAVVPIQSSSTTAPDVCVVRSIVAVVCEAVAILCTLVAAIT